MRAFQREAVDIGRALSRRGPTDPAVVRALTRTAIRRAFGARAGQVLLFGSRARGDHRPDSDWDVAVLLTGARRAWLDAVAAGDVRTALLDDTGELVDVVTLEPEDLARTPLGAAIRRDGVPL